MSHRYIRFRHAPDVLSRNLGDETLVTTPGEDEVQSLRGSALAVWTLLGEGTTYPDLLAELSFVFDVSIGALEDDVKSLLDDLVSRNLVEGLV